MSRATRPDVSPSRPRRARQRVVVGIEVLEVRSLLSSAAVIQWRMAPRFTPDPNRGGQVDLPNTPAYVNPPDGYEVLLDASHSQGVQRGASFTWTITASAGSPIVVKGANPDVRLPEGTYAVQLEADNLRGAKGPVFTSSSVVVKDRLIVAIGDSYASGEGNPVVPGYSVFRSPRWAYSPDTAMNLENTNAHRSTLAGPAQFALALQASDPHVAVTFVSVANSGATIAQGLLGPMPSIGDPNAILPAQIDELHRIVGSHPIDTLTISIGANDIGFSTRVQQLITSNAVGTPTLGTIQGQVEASLATLSPQYAMLGQAIRGLNPAKVLITEYPDLTRNSRGLVAPVVVAGVSVISTAEVQFALDRILNPLDQTVQAAATANGWTYVGGLSTAFRTHGYPSSNSWFRSVGQSYRMQDSRVGAFHPNAQGHQAIAKGLLAAYQQARPPGT